MSVLDLLIPKPTLSDIDRAAVDAQRGKRCAIWTLHNQSTLVRTLFALRTIPDRLKGKTRSFVFG